jgi:hypothetical protein
VITTNDATSLTIASAWITPPDTTSQFVITEGAWKFAAIAATSPVQFSIPYQPGTVIEVTGRGANVNNLESAAELCPITRVALGGGNVSTGTTVAPNFNLAAPGAGLLTLSQIAFPDLSNVSSVSSGTLQLFSWSELSNPGAFTLAGPIDAVSNTVALTQAPTGFVGQALQIGTELMTVISVDTQTNSYQVTRGALSSTSTAHAANDPVLHLDTSTLVVPFALSFFDSRAAANFVHNVTAPDLRVAAAGLFVTNAFGDSEATVLCYTAQAEGGLRTLSGGQFSLQVSGALATQQNASPGLMIEASHAVRDVRASMLQAPAGYTVQVDLLQNGTEYCSLTIPGPQSATLSNVLDGVTLPPLIGGASLTVNVTLNVTAGFTGPSNPGRDLTVTIRL